MEGEIVTYQKLCLTTVCAAFQAEVNINTVVFINAFMADFKLYVHCMSLYTPFVLDRVNVHVEIGKTICKIVLCG